ncbi:MAG TPA: hypothetical protein VMZ05_09700, partial [Spirochaetota bacterium]|nr:hypothetical protein [Spirochaetota bacterium]
FDEIAPRYFPLQELQGFISLSLLLFIHTVYLLLLKEIKNQAHNDVLHNAASTDSGLYGLSNNMPNNDAKPNAYRDSED